MKYTTTIPGYMDEMNCLLRVKTHESGIIHMSWLLEDGKVISFEEIPENYPTGTLSIFATIDDYAKAIKDVSWLNDADYIMRKNDDILGPKGYPFNQDDEEPACNHRDAEGNLTIEYDDINEMRSGDMRCTQCGARGTRKQLTIAGEKKTFYESYVARAVTADDIDDYIEAWHNGAGRGKSLSEYLGMTDKQFAVYVKTDVIIDTEDEEQ